MNSSYEQQPGLLSPLSQFLQDGGGNQQQTTSMGTPRPGTPRGSHFRLSPDGNLNPGTPGAASTHDHHKFPNSPWSGSEPATPGSGYSRNAVVPSSPYISSYPNTPATPGGGGFYQKPCGIPPSNGNGNGNTTAVPPGSPWTDRSVCTPGPMTPLTPATPMHSAMSDHGGGGGSNGSFGNSGSPTFPTDTSSSNNNNNSGKSSSVHNAPSLAALLQEVPTDSLVPVPVMNHSVQQNAAQQQQQQQHHHQQQPPNSVPNQNGNSGNPNQALAPNNVQSLFDDDEVNNSVDNNPNLIFEFEQFFEDFMNTRRNEDSNRNRNQSQQPQPQQQQQQQHPPPPPPQQNNIMLMQQHNPQSHLQQQQPQQPQPHPPQQQQQQQLMSSMNGMGMGNGNPGMIYNGNNGMPPNNGQQQMMMNNGHGHMMGNGIPMGGGGGPMRTNKFIGQNHHHGQHPYMTMGGNPNAGGGSGLMMRARQIPGPGHLQQQQQPHSNHYGPGMPPHHQQQQHHPHQQSMMGGIQGMQANRPGSQFGLQHHQQQSASVYAPPPSGNNGGYVQIQQQQQQPHPQHTNMNGPPPNYQNVQPHHPHAPPQNQGPVHWQSNAQQQSQQPPQHSQSLNNHGMVNTAGQNGMMSNGRTMPQQPQQPQQQQQPSQPNPYFQNNPVNPVMSNDQGLSNGGGGSVLPPTTYPFDLNGGGGGGPGSNNPSLPMTPGTSAMQDRLGPRTPQPVPVQSPMSIGMGMPSTPQPNTPHMVGIDDQVNLDLDGPYDGSNISQSAWNKALDKCSRPNAVCEVAKVLFDEIFTDDEVIQCTFSGRGSTKKFNPNKVNYLKKATAWIMTKPAMPWEFNIATCGDLTLNPDDESGTRGVEKKVFTEYRSRRRGDILKIRGQNGTGPPSVSSVS